MTTTSFQLTALVLTALAEGEEIKLGGRRMVVGEIKGGEQKLACVGTATFSGGDVEDILLPMSNVTMEMLVEWCEQAVAITHQLITAHDGTEIHFYHFPDDVPDFMREAAYTRALAALKAAHPEAHLKYPVGTSGQGYSIHLAPLPPCTCGCGAGETSNA